MESGMIYYLDHGKKTIAELNVADIGDFKKMMGLDETDPAQKMQIQMMEQMMQMQKISVTVTPTEETMEIDGYKCTKYDQVTNVGMASVSTVIWATEDVKYDNDVVEKMRNFHMGLLPGFKEMAEEMKKIKGLVVKSTGSLNVMGTTVSMNSNLIEYKTADAPAGSYGKPSDYKQVKGLSLPGM